MRKMQFLFLAGMLLLPATGLVDNPSAVAPDTLAGLNAAGAVTRDTYGVAHIRAGNEHDLFFLQGYVHAQDRLFQMDVNRRQASGTLAELLGPGALPSDVEVRTIGVRRAALRSWAVISRRAQAALEAYAEGVNAWVATHPLPPDYGAIEITRFAPWTALDSLTVAKSIAFSLSFGLDDIDNTVALQTYTAVFDPVFGPGTGRTLFAEDLWRSQPFDPASTVPDASVATPGSGGPKPQHGHHPRFLGQGPVTSQRPTSRMREGGSDWAGQIDARRLQEPALELARRRAEVTRSVPFLGSMRSRDDRPGSNQWAVSGRFSESGLPLVANDPHLSLGTPTTFYPIHLSAGPTDVMGSGFAGVPFVIVGQNRDIAWGATVNPLDVTDVFQEQVVPDPTSPSQLSTLYNGQLEWVIPIPEAYRINVIGDGAADTLTSPPAGSVPPVTLIVPRRNMGPIVDLDPASGVAFSVQYTGFSGTREVDTFLIWGDARGLEDFVEGLQYFDSGTQNFAYADVHGNIAYFASSEVPVREDLQAGTVVGLPPWFIRNGQGGNEWLPVQTRQPGQAVPYEILPFEEMPHIVNPPAGWFVNANNDPAGTTLDNNPLNQLRPGGGLYYLNAGYDAGFRAGRITDLVRERLALGGRMSFGEMQAIQADTALLDASFFVPYIEGAMMRARASGAHPALAAFAARPNVVEALARLTAWDFTTPTGIREGYDASDENGRLADPTDEEKRASVAATIYGVWRGQFIRNTIDATLGAIPLPPGITLPRPGSQLAVTALANMLDDFDPATGQGASGLSFFNVPGVASALDRRDIVILASLDMALTRLAGEPFRPAFAMSGDQNDYNWGKLHRIVFRHPIGAPFSIPPAGGAFPAPLPGLTGLPADGGFGAVDASNHDARAQGANDFMFGSGPVNRFVAEAGMPGVRAESVWPGGTSGVLGSAYYANLLPLWLTNDTIPLLFGQHDLNKSTLSVEQFVPARGR
jgi:penicillin amidase